MLLQVEPPGDPKLLAYITILRHVVTSLIINEQLGCCNSVNSIVIIIIIYIILISEIILNHFYAPPTK